MISEIVRSVILNRRNKMCKDVTHKPFLSVIKRKFRVGLADIDFNLHVNNSRYMVFMERGRWDHSVQTNTWDVMVKQKLNSIIAGIEMGYIREIRFGKTFDLETRCIGWDNKYVYLEQRFVVADKIYAYGLVKAVYFQRGKLITPASALALLGVEQTSESLPQHLEIWKSLASAKKEFSSAN